MLLRVNRSRHQGRITQTAVITVASASHRILNVLDIARTRYTLLCRKQQFLRIIVSGRQWSMNYAAGTMCQRYGGNGATGCGCIMYCAASHIHMQRTRINTIVCRRMLIDRSVQVHCLTYWSNSKLTFSETYILSIRI